MTGYENLVQVLRYEGFTPQKIDSNERLIMAVIRILSENSDGSVQIAAAQKLKDDAQGERVRAFHLREEAERLQRTAERQKRDAEEARDRAEETKAETTRRALRIKELLNEIAQYETAEARDRARLFALFMESLPKNADRGSNAVIYGMGGILGMAPFWNGNGRKKDGDAS